MFTNEKEDGCEALLKPSLEQNCITMHFFGREGEERWGEMREEKEGGKGGEWGELSEEERDGVGETVFKNVSFFLKK